jgi:DNA replication and repair protein RecF
MRLQEITLKGFRNYQEQKITPHPRFNVLSGQNGQGKTNFLEAIYYLGALRSFRGQNPKELLRWEEVNSRLTAKVEHEGPGLSRDLTVEINPKGRRFFVNGKTPKTVGDYAEELLLVIFVPDDVAVARSSPETRRRFLDRAVFGAESAHLSDTLTYGRALKSRNVLLKSPQPNADLLDAFDEMLATIGGRLVLRRRRFLARFLGTFQEVHREFAPNAPEVSYQYRGPEGSSADEIADELREMFRKGRERDLRLKSTGSGPHTDDLMFLLDERPIKHSGSQGEQRTSILAWKIAEIQFLFQERHERPILLLDDVSSELDRYRAARFFTYVREGQGQVFLTTTDPSFIPLEIDGESRCDFRVNNGRITQTSDHALTATRPSTTAPSAPSVVASPTVAPLSAPSPLAGKIPELAPEGPTSPLVAVIPVSSVASSSLEENGALSTATTAPPVTLSSAERVSAPVSDSLPKDAAPVASPDSLAGAASLPRADLVAGPAVSFPVESVAAPLSASPAAVTSPVEKLSAENPTDRQALSLALHPAFADDALVGEGLSAKEARETGETPGDDLSQEGPSATAARETPGTSGEGSPRVETERAPSPYDRSGASLLAAYSLDLDSDEEEPEDEEEPDEEDDENAD